ncbi:hypothetical protein [Dyadobacter sediminis]|uniref:Uncharacterized protein n=1 Tax=Dyadobacter sediminis TaxID=1493691 RepID=A0A5R9K751_9BACT|nr:hypothetical protein [Dyadobacter sediminis]TLU89609.1 hypothetical protein FEM55_23020 [Dyadobacter sediminis]GGC03886.1 hypothetical protein GCM10011325_33570 [Dyadobacter sediminis]
MSGQEFNLKFNELKLLQEMEREVLYLKSNHLEYELELAKLKLLHKKEIDHLTEKMADAEQDENSEIYQLKALHKRELENFMKEVACTDQRQYKLKIDYLKLRHRIELLAAKKKSESKMDELEMLHRGELKTVMKKLEYIEQTHIPKSDQLALRHQIERNTLIETFVLANKLYNIGDIISDHAGSISVRLYSYVTSNNSFEMLYKGIILTKDGEHRKDGAHRSVLESDVKSCYRPLANK